ncbi:MAG: rod shape-determining protein RodA [Candidatus Moraniibacteriota bacterium]|nr:MAG: rod shape-determining protein RodA [Candidatus Moranbacteria bacterium]
MFRRFFQGDWVLLSATYLLLGVGLLTIYSLSGGFPQQHIFVRQAVFAAIGTVILVSFPLFDYRHLSKLSTPLYFLAIGILALVLIFGSTIRGTSGWLQFFGFQFQPVEFSKIVLIIFLASFISQKRSELGDFVRLFASFVLTSILVFLVLRQPDLGSALVLAGIWFFMVVVSGIRRQHLLLLGTFFAIVISVSWFFLAPYQKDRISTFLHPDQDRQGSGYNVFQALVAVGSGGIGGKGLGHGSQSQFQFLPERHTDFIYAVVSEELGFIGAALVLFLFGVLLFRVVRAALLARDNFGFLLGMGIASMIFIQTAVNIGMNIGVLPVTGIPLPLLSYGGSSLLSIFIGMAIVQNIVSRRREHESHEWSGV